MTWSTTTQSNMEPDFLAGEKGGRALAHNDAIREALRQSLRQDPRVFIMGQGVDDPLGMFGTTVGLQSEFGSDRVFDTPLSESALTGVAIGAAMGGMRPVYMHNRPDFLLLAMDQIVNHAAKWSYMFGGAVHVPVVIWACIGRGWGSAAQHSQALQSLFMHIPGLKLVMPSTCYDAKGLMLAAIDDPNPVLILDHRFNFRQRGAVPSRSYHCTIGTGIVRREGKDVTIIAFSHLVTEAFCAAEELAAEGIDIEVVDPRTLRPLDEDIILDSAAKTGRVVVTDCGWRTGGVTAEIAAMVAEKGFSSLKAPIMRVTAPDLPTPAARVLEDAYYVGKEKIKSAVRSLF